MLQVRLNFQENISLQVTRKRHHLCGLHVRVEVLGQVAAAFQASASTLDMLACSSRAQFRPEKQSSVNPGSGTSSAPGLAVGLVWSLIGARTGGGQSVQLYLSRLCSHICDPLQSCARRPSQQFSPSCGSSRAQAPPLTLQRCLMRPCSHFLTLTILAAGREEPKS